MNFPRSSGILLHPTSLPGPFGIGDLGPEAYAFTDFLEAAGQSLWQMLPLGPTGYGNSPYSGYSAFAGNTLLISPEQLIADGLINNEQFAPAPIFSDERINFEAVQNFKDSILSNAFESFKQNSVNPMSEAFEKFCELEAEWLNDYALFRALKDQHDGAAWSDWPPALRQREIIAIETAGRELSDQIEAQKFYQFLFFRQWLALKSYGNERGIKLIGDLPIFVAYDSADVWTNPKLFRLNDEGKPLVVAGVPPDYFSETGQLWGNPIYEWERMQSDGFAWWIKRVRSALKTFDMVRLDHSRGFAACWEIPAGEPTAERGEWVKVPGRELFAAIERALGEAPLFAEDLGVITPDVETLREELGLAGMRVLQFAFGSDENNTNLPLNHTQNVVVYTGTHDNDTALGWFASAAVADEEREFCLKYLKTDGEEINWDLIRAAFASVANTAIIPLQDVLGLGSEARMNMPNSTEGNWLWRFKANALNKKIAERLRALSELYGRYGPRKSGGEPAFPTPS